jgi:hypothetical protein
MKLDEAGVLEAVEIGNEPNNFEVGGLNEWSMSYQDFADLVTWAWIWLRRYYNEGKLSREVPVISGGILAFAITANATPSRNGPAGTEYLKWIDYFKKFQQHVCANFEVGFHPYPLNLSQTPTQNIARVLTMTDEILAATTRNVWITETGSTSRSPRSDIDQKDVVKGICTGMASRPRIKGVFLHRLFDAYNEEGKPYEAFGVCRNVGWDYTSIVPKAAYTEMANLWA